ncbi:hypothetical protein GY45DRAFT_1321480 [Cubamyces sp. BRFM 1775]|nr:hypothetical protein GY45DRAFT_1321480 [Cubamyces sp. BRFM 1775]
MGMTGERAVMRVSEVSLETRTRRLGRRTRSSSRPDSCRDFPTTGPNQVRNEAHEARPTPRIERFHRSRTAVNHRQRSKLCCLMRHQGIRTANAFSPTDAVLVRIVCARCPIPILLSVWACVANPAGGRDVSDVPTLKGLTSSRGLAGKISTAPDLPSSELAARLESHIRSESR